MAELLFRDDAYLKACDATVVSVQGNTVELDRTVFYPMGGGQAGDTGTLGAARVLDTRKGSGGDSVLHIVDDASSLSVGAKVDAALDWERRHRLMRYHTVLHLLGSIVKAPVTGGASPKTRRISTSTSRWRGCSRTRSSPVSMT
jgi:misacylated tRNA(Ala) deacylase